MLTPSKRRITSSSTSTTTLSTVTLLNSTSMSVQSKLLSRSTLIRILKLLQTLRTVLSYCANSRLFFTVKTSRITSTKNTTSCLPIINNKSITLRSSTRSKTLHLPLLETCQLYQAQSLGLATCSTVFRYQWSNSHQRLQNKRITNAQSKHTTRLVTPSSHLSTFGAQSGSPKSKRQRQVSKLLLSFATLITTSSMSTSTQKSLPLSVKLNVSHVLELTSQSQPRLSSCKKRSLSTITMNFNSFCANMTVL
jgi:hypothetical protein